MRIIGYVRVSTGEQAESGAGLASQHAAIEAAVQARGYVLIRVIEDAGASGKSLARTGLAEALELVESGAAEGIMVAKLDRLSRSLLDFAALTERSRKHGWALIALDLGVDTSTPQGEMMANVLATFAQFERRLIGQRTKDALAIRKAQGVKLGRPRIIPDDVRARVSASRRRGVSLHRIAAELTSEGVQTAHGGKRWYASTVAGLVKA